MSTKEELTQQEKEAADLVAKETARKGAGATPPTFDEWLTGQDEATKNLIETRFAALSNTVKATRDERDILTKQMRDAAKKLEEGSEARKSLEVMSAQLEEAEKRTLFIEDAIKPEIGCRNPRAAWLLAKADDLFTRSGSPDWEALRKAAPELFGKVAGEAHPGAGTGEKPPAKSDMNAWIRQKSGRA